MISIQYVMTSITLWDYVHTSLYEHWAWFYMEHYILCDSMYMCIALHYAHQAGYLRGSHQFQFQLSFWVARLVTTRGLGVYCLQYVLTIFLFAGFSSVRYVLPDYVDLGLKLHTCILFTVYVHYMFMNATS